MIFSLFDFRKIVVVLFLTFTVINISTAQKVSITDEKFKEHKEAGDKYFEDEEFFLAAQEFHKAEKLKPADHYTLWKLAESYRLYQDYDDAEIWYKKLGAHPDHNYPLSIFWLGLMEKVQGKYLEAEATLNNFTKSFVPKTDEDKIKLKEAEFEYKGCIFALEQLKKPLRDHKVTLLPTPVNSKATDYAPMIFFHDTSIVITSARADSKGTEMNMATGEARSDNFRFEKNGATWVRHHNDDNFDIVNTPKDDGAGELTHDQSKYYYTICDPECGIFVSKKLNGKFTKPIKLNKNINANGYWNAQPTVSPTADTMFFVSKRPGGKGQHDIWMSVNKDKTGSVEDWGPALNLVNINTPYVEITPFWDDHTNTIYFASNGHAGFGGWDIYVAKGTKRDSIVNLGLPFNSSRDDFYFTLGKEKGYLVSNRDGGIGKDDIYTFDIHAKESEVGAIPKDSFADAQSVASVGRIILGDNQVPVADLPVYLKDETGAIIKEARTNANGEFRFENLPPDKNFKIIINESDPRIKTQIDYQVEKKAGTGTTSGIAANPSNTSSASNNTTSSSSTSATTTNNTGEYTGNGKVLNKTTQKPAPNVPVSIINANGEAVKSVKTNANGQFFVAGLPGGTTYIAKVTTPNPALVITSNFKQEGDGNGTKLANNNATSPAAAIETTPASSTTSSNLQNGTNAASAPTPTTAPAPVAIANELTAKTTEGTITTPASSSNTTEYTTPATTAPVTETSPTATETTIATQAVVTTIESKAASTPKAKNTESNTELANTPFANNNTNTPATQRAGNKSKVVIDQFKIKSSDRKPTKTFFENVYYDFNSVELTASAKKAMDNLISI